MSGRHATGNRYLDNLDIMLDANTGPLFGTENIRLFTYVLHDHGRQLFAELNIQSIQHPGMGRSTESVWLIGLRFQVNRGWSW